jgi:5-methyltetrahydropteroyltriglutamate--homocysteine methyltransferase
MATTERRILTTHVGSLVRPPELVTYLRAIDRGEPYDQKAYRECLRRSVRDVVRRQVEAGIDVVSDGEYGKSVTWSFYVHERLGGIELRDAPPRPGQAMRGLDRNRFPEFYAEYERHQEFSLRGQWVCTGPITYRGQDALGRDIANLSDAAQAEGAHAAFLPVAAPASAFPWWVDEHYGGDEEAFLYAVADALREEYRLILDAGLYVQVDDAFLPYMYEVLAADGATMEEYRAWARLRVDVLNHALRGLPADRIRYHVCWGSWNAPHTGDVALRDIVDLVLDVNASSYLIEAANPRHEHEWRLWEDVELPAGKILVPGVIAHTTNVVEHPELVAERLVRLARVVGPARVMGGTDCGFAQGPFVARVHPSIQWAKLAALAEGAALATRELYPREPVSSS